MTTTAQKNWVSGHFANNAKLRAAKREARNRSRRAGGTGALYKESLRRARLDSTEFLTP